MVGGVLYNSEDINKQMRVHRGHRRKQVERKAGDATCEMREDDLRENQKNREVDSRELKG